VAWHLSRRDRGRALTHLEIAFPELSPDERRGLARANFEHYGTMLAEAFWLRHRGPEEIERIVSFEGWKEIDAARGAKRPILILTGHCGNWEILAAALNVRGLGMAVVARELEDPGLHEMLLALRARFGTKTIVRGTPGAARALLAALRSGGALGMLIDQDTRVDGVFVPFFGRPAYTPVGAAELALRFDAVVLPTFIERQENGTHRARIEPPLQLPNDATAATALMTERIEAQIRRVPAQWVWLHRRWRRKPVVSET
jgi:KDO2-lipid IV(A) lauroyltransferase